MSNYHVLQTDRAGNALTVVFHVAVPDQNNLAGYSYRTALTEMRGTPVVSAVPYITVGEQTSLDEGSLEEVTRQLDSNPSEDLSAKQARLDAAYAGVVTITQTRIQTQLEYYGHDRDVP